MTRAGSQNWRQELVTRAGHQNWRSELVECHQLAAGVTRTDNKLVHVLHGVSFYNVFSDTAKLISDVDTQTVTDLIKNLSTGSG